MPTNTAREPSALVFDFGAQLSHAIRSDVLIFVLLYAFGEASDANTDFLDRLRHHLLAARGINRFIAVLRAVAALDFVLARATLENPDSTFVMHGIARTASPDSANVLVRTLLGMPLRQKYFERALAEWDSLRSTTLTAQT